MKQLLQQTSALVLQHQRFRFHLPNFSLAAFLLSALRNYPSEADREGLFSQLVTLENKAADLSQRIVKERVEQLGELLLRPKQLVLCIQGLKGRVKESRLKIKRCQNNLIDPASLTTLYGRAKQQQALLKHIPALASYPRSLPDLLRTLKDTQRFRASLPQYLEGTILCDHLTQYVQRLRLDLLSGLKKEIDALSTLPSQNDLKTVAYNPDKRRLFQYLQFMWSKAPCPASESLDIAKEAGFSDALTKYLINTLDSQLSRVSNQIDGIKQLKPAQPCSEGTFLAQMGMTSRSVSLSALERVSLLSISLNILARRISLAQDRLQPASSKLDLSLLFRRINIALRKQLSRLLQTFLLAYPICQKLVGESQRILAQHLPRPSQDDEGARPDVEFEARLSQSINSYADKLFGSAHFYDFSPLSEKELQLKLGRGYSEGSRKQRSAMIALPHFQQLTKELALQGVVDVLILVEEAKQILLQWRKRRISIALTLFAQTFVLLRMRLLDLAGSVLVPEDQPLAVPGRVSGLLETSWGKQFLKTVAARTQQKTKDCKLNQLRALNSAAEALLLSYQALLKDFLPAGQQILEPSVGMADALQRISRGQGLSQNSKAVGWYMNEEGDRSEVSSAGGLCLLLGLLVKEGRVRLQQLRCRRTGYKR